MAKLNELGQLWKVAGEIDVRAIQEAAMQTPRLAFVGSAEGAGRLQGFLQRGPHATNQPLTTAPTFRLPLSYSDVATLANYDLRVMVLQSLDQLRRDDVAAVAAQPAALLVILDGASTPIATIDAGGSATTQPHRVLVGALDDPKAIADVVLPAFLEAVRGRELAWARAYPGLRPQVAQKLIQDTCLTNAGYALGTGVAELVPVLTFPFALADMIILTKNQLVMSYKIAMLMGDMGTLRDLLPKLASVVGAGFMWRQIARELVGLLPLGLVLKVAIAYAGTYATGQAVYHWYANGERLNPQELKALFQEGVRRSQAVAVQLTARMRKEKSPPALLTGPGTAADVTAGPGAPAGTGKRLRKGRHKRPAAQG